MRHGEELDAISAGAEHLMRGMERRMMEELARMLRRNAGSVTAASDYLVNRAHELSVSKQAVQDILRETAAEFSRAVDEVYDEALKADYTRCGDLYRAQGKQQIPYEENAALQQLIGAVKAQTNDAFQNITATTGFIDKDGNFTLFADYWQQTLDTAAMDVLSGTIPYEKALGRITRELTNSGLRTVDYASGHKDRVEVAARRALLTGVNQVVTHITEEQMDELNTPYVEVEWHGTARPEHQVWQGKIYYWAERDRAKGVRQNSPSEGLTAGENSGTIEVAEHAPAPQNQITKFAQQMTGIGFEQVTGFEGYTESAVHLQELASDFRRIQADFPSVFKGIRLDLGTAPTMDADAYAGFDPQTRTLHLNPKFYNHIASYATDYASDVAKRYHPAGTTYRSTVFHEVGHILEEMLGTRNKALAKQLFEEAHPGQHFTRKLGDEWLSKNLCWYATEYNYDEMIAEAMAEFYDSPQPRELCKKIVDAIKRKE